MSYPQFFLFRSRTLCKLIIRMLSVFAITHRHKKTAIDRSIAVKKDKFGNDLYARSMITAYPCPTPMHIVASA